MADGVNAATTNRVTPPREPEVEIDSEWPDDLTEFEALFNGSPVRRAGFNGLRRNIAIAMANCGLRQFVPVLQQWSGAADQGLHTAAQWALKKLTAGS